MFNDIFYWHHLFGFYNACDLVEFGVVLVSLHLMNNGVVKSNNQSYYSVFNSHPLCFACLSLNRIFFHNNCIVVCN